VHGRIFQTIDDFREAVRDFVLRYDTQWLVEKNGHLSLRPRYAGATRLYSPAALGCRKRVMPDFLLRHGAQIVAAGKCGCVVKWCPRRASNPGARLQRGPPLFRRAPEASNSRSPILPNRQSSLWSRPVPVLPIPKPLGGHVGSAWSNMPAGSSCHAPGGTGVSPSRRRIFPMMIAYRRRRQRALGPVPPGHRRRLSHQLNGREAPPYLPADSPGCALRS
jgi:hypothetical protein